MRYRSHIVTAAFCAALLLSAAPSWAQIRIGVSINVAPPPLPVYEQPPLPASGYIWVPGYWAWGVGDYYWVPGTWVEPPESGLLWTPGYWGWSDGDYIWHEGYWGNEVGFYGGVDYGFGYDGVGYAGGYWSHGAFFYNRAVNRIPAGVHLTHLYNRAESDHHTSHVSFNGGRGGVQTRPSAAQLTAQRGRHLSPIAAQRQQEQLAGRNPALRVSTNHGRPPIAATTRPGQFDSHGGAAPHAPVPRDNVNPRDHVNIDQPAHQLGHPAVTIRNDAPRTGAAPSLPAAAAPRFNPERQAGPEIRQNTVSHPNVPDAPPHPEAAPHRETHAGGSNGPQNPRGAAPEGAHTGGAQEHKGGAQDQKGGAQEHKPPERPQP